MSRIQDILAKAERDGTARRTHTETAVAAPVATTIVAPVDGSSALDPKPFVDASRFDTTPALDALPFAPSGLPATLTAADEPRTARATLHPALVAAISPQSPVAEQYRAVRTRLMMREESAPLRTVMITSPGARDGKSITAANLALTMAQEIQRSVILVDADLRRPSLHRLFGIEGQPGLSDVLNGTATLDEALIRLPEYRLTILPAGPRPDYPTELLGSGTMRRLVDTLRARFDRILLDLPAVAPLADVSTLAPIADGVLMVVRAGVTQRPALTHALGVFEENKMLGVVLNDAR